MEGELRQNKMQAAFRIVYLLCADYPGIFKVINAFRNTDTPNKNLKQDKTFTVIEDAAPTAS